MEPEDLAIYANDVWSVPKNLSSICISFDKIHARGSFPSTNPLDYTLPLFLFQSSIASSVIFFTCQLLRPLNQPIFVSQTLGGIILGPSVIGRSALFILNVFPIRSFILLDIVSSIGFMFYFFLVGVQMDPWILKKISRKTFTIGISTVVVPMVLTRLFIHVLPKIFNLDNQLAESLLVIANAESVLAFPTIASLLAELKIINSEFGRTAMCSSVVSGLFCFCITTSIVLAHQASDDNLRMLSTMSTGVVFVLVVVFIVRPVVVWMMRQNPAGGPVKQSHIVYLFIGVLVSGFCSLATGLHVYFGPLILGIAIPTGPPLGVAITEKLELVNQWMFMPIFFLKNGLIIDVFTVQLKNCMIVLSIAIVGALGKFLGAFSSSIYWSMPWMDATALGFLSNFQGLLELGMFKLMMNSGIDPQSFAIMCICMLIISGISAPVVKRLYDPSRRYLVYKRRTVMNAKPNSYFRILIVMHEPDSAPTAINLLEALNPTLESPLAVTILFLLELVGHGNPVLIPHNKLIYQKRSSKLDIFERVGNAFRRYEQNNHKIVSVYPYTAISPYATMHDDVCTLALDQRTRLVIVPYNKKFNAKGVMGSYKNAFRIIFNNVLEVAPCSVAILVDSGQFGSSLPIVSCWSSYRVGVIFLGGADDREALAIGARMVDHPNISLTMIRLVVNENVAGDDEEGRLDGEFLSEFRQAMVGNYRVMYIEEVVMDGSGTVSVINSLENDYELVLVGRSHDRTSPLLLGLTNWSGNEELGQIGEILASSELMGKTTLLVVQQHNKGVITNEGSIINHKESARWHFSNKAVQKENEEEMPIHGIGRTL
ncbi:hypothetical protein UlMin_013848 [Ulmus minor]